MLNFFRGSIKMCPLLFSVAFLHFTSWTKFHWQIDQNKEWQIGREKNFTDSFSSTLGLFSYLCICKGSSSSSQFFHFPFFEAMTVWSNLICKKDLLGTHSQKDLVTCRGNWQISKFNLLLVNSFENQSDKVAQKLHTVELQLDAKKKVFYELLFVIYFFLLSPADNKRLFCARIFFTPCQELLL